MSDFTLVRDGILLVTSFIFLLLVIVGYCNLCNNVVNRECEKLNYQVQTEAEVAL